jgi:hypothetical protein
MTCFLLLLPLLLSSCESTRGKQTTKQNKLEYELNTTFRTRLTRQKKMNSRTFLVAQQNHGPWLNVFSSEMAKH